MVQNQPFIDNTLLPPPFEWIAIPGGQVTLKAGGYLPEPATFDVAPFAIGKYPITNRQYELFIAAGGYANQAWWTVSGWKFRERNGWIEPRFWGQSDYDHPDAPVIGVTWFEAMAYCRWLSAESGQPVTIPTEQQWQWAAQGDDGRLFPWGDVDPTPDICNWARRYDGTAPVTAYPENVSPFGVMDMCGNVWEWCRTGWESGTTDLEGSERRIVRGGSWVNDSLLNLMITLRDGPYPVDGYHLCGFRIALQAD
ncbi:MAG: SUMF1/EgtB/PvdO family nonheme iron enzyme [Anaerolineae bacterium]|nr:SUMF1/EgtB/PvdO family nonheme iron enzyme [Anaerolineae bacterium]